MSSQPIPQACAIPFRRTKKGVIEFCLITSSGSRRWIFPKGLVDPGYTHAQTAAKETGEEAGVFGRLITPTIARYNYRKLGLKLRVKVYLLEVRREARIWQEAGRRQRRWCRPAEVRRRLGRPELQRVFERALSRLAG